MASITVEEQQAVIKPLLEAVSGIETVLTDFPPGVEQSKLPMIITTPREATYDRRTDGKSGYRVRRRWYALLLILAPAQGREYQGGDDVKPFLTTIPDTLAAHPRVRLDDGRAFDLDLHQGGDRGEDPFRYNKKLYASTVFTFYTETLTRIEPS